MIYVDITTVCWGPTNANVLYNEKTLQFGFYYNKTWKFP